VVRRVSDALPRLDGLVVLAVDDDGDAREITRQMLEPLGARVLVAADADETLRLMRRERPHIVLCDLLMPGTDGFELTRHLRGTTVGRQLPIVAVTALGRETDYYRTWEAGFDGHLTKPIDYADLAWVVRILTRPRSTRSGGAWFGVGEAADPRRRLPRSKGAQFGLGEPVEPRRVTRRPRPRPRRD
jgi:CheY-like chemotaxis protein